MDLSKVKLVITDMDGTLLNSKHEISERFFELFEKLKPHIHFVVASGRQYFSMVDKLMAIKDEITIVAENGGLVKRGNKELSFVALKRSLIDDILPVLRGIPNAQIILAGKKAAYVESKEDYFLDLFTEFYSNHQLVDDLIKVDDELMKIAIYHPISSEDYIYPHLTHFNSSFQFKISGQNWLDIAAPYTNKGNALDKIQTEFQINADQTMAFGDFHNDIEMLSKAHFSFAMANAHPDIKSISNYETASNNHYGVEQILEKLLAAKI